MTPTQKAVDAAVKAMKALEDEATADPENIFGADLTSLAEAAITAALAMDGLCLVPKEPTAKMIAAAFPTEGDRPPPDDMKIGAEAILILEGGRDCGSITGPAVIEAASMCKDYRAMIAASSDGGPPREDNKK